MTGYSFRYIAALQKVWELVQAGAVGEIHTITGNIGVGPSRRAGRQGRKPAAGLCCTWDHIWWTPCSGIRRTSR